MAGYGSIDNGRGHRTKAELATRKVGDPGPVPAPELPAGYSPTVILWFDTWCNSPQSALFTNTDWQRLLMLAPLVELYFVSPDKATMAEIRLNESLLGATVVDRLRGKIEFVSAKVPDAPAEDDELKARRTSRSNNVA